MPNVPKNQNIKCNGRAVVRYPKDYRDVRLRAQPILDPDGRKQYKPCGAWAVHGSTVCAAHGGDAPQVMAAAKKRLALATNNIAEMLEDIALDMRLPADVRIKAAAQIMDRAGIRAGVDLGLEAPKWQGVLGKLFGNPEPDEAEPAAEPEVQYPFVDVESAPPPRRKAAPRKASAKEPGKPKFEGW